MSDLNNDQNKNFLDSRTIIAIALVGLVWFGWQTYLGKKYPQANKPVASPEATTTPTAENTETKKDTTTADKAAAPALKTSEKKAPVEEKLTAYENDEVSMQFSSKGMGIKSLVLKKHNDRAHQPMVMGATDNHSLFEMATVNSEEPIDFAITKVSDHVFEGVATVGTTKIIRTIEISPDTQGMKNTVLLQNIGEDFRGIVVAIPEKAMEHASGSFLIPSFEHQELIVLHSGKEERVNTSSSKEKVVKEFANVSLAGIGTQYFTSAMVDKSEIIPEARISGGGLETKEIFTKVIYKTNNGKANQELKWFAFSGPKSLSTLEKIDKELSKVVNLGFFNQIARILLVLLKWFHSVFGNWGVAIILLTLLVRLLVLPLNVTTFKSTKKMQKLQPLIAAIRERYKDDPQAMNRETMGLWKEHKVNPLGGCLPMLLQLPIFFALYQVLGQSIELYQAPFFGWIHDLSVKDPFYVLPVLMGICMYFQGKLTPTTMDPTQQKIMQFLPVVFSLMMISLPAGLTLYIFINTLAGILLQQMFMRDPKTAVAKTAKA